MLIIAQKVTKTLAGRTERPRGPHAARSRATCLRPLLYAIQSTPIQNQHLQFVCSAVNIQLGLQSILH